MAFSENEVHHFWSLSMTRTHLYGMSKRGVLINGCCHNETAQTGRFKQQKLICHSSEGWEAPDQSVWEELSSWLTDGHLPTVTSCGREGGGRKRGRGREGESEKGGGKRGREMKVRREEREVREESRLLLLKPQSYRLQPVCPHLILITS